MSGDKTRGKETRDRSTEDTQVLHHTHRETTLLFLMVVGEGITDTQITDTLRQGFPHLTDPVSLHDRHGGQQPKDSGTTEKDKQSVEQKRT